MSKAITGGMIVVALVCFLAAVWANSGPTIAAKFVHSGFLLLTASFFLD